MSSALARERECREIFTESPIWYLDGAGRNPVPEQIYLNGLRNWEVDGTLFNTCKVNEFGRGFDDELEREIQCYVEEMSVSNCTDSNCTVPVYLIGYSRGGVILDNLIDRIIDIPHIQVNAFFIDPVVVATNYLRIPIRDNLNAYNFYQQNVEGSLIRNRENGCNAFRGDIVHNAQNTRFTNEEIDHCNIWRNSLGYIDDLILENQSYYPEQEFGCLEVHWGLY